MGTLSAAVSMAASLGDPGVAGVGDTSGGVFPCPVLALVDVSLVPRLKAGGVVLGPGIYENQTSSSPCCDIRASSRLPLSPLAGGLAATAGIASHPGTLRGCPPRPLPPRAGH